MKAKYKVLHVEYNYVLKTKQIDAQAQEFSQKILVSSVDLHVVDVNGTVLTCNIPHNPWVNVGDEVIIDRTYSGQRCCLKENLTRKQQIADFIAKNKQK